MSQLLHKWGRHALIYLIVALVSILSYMYYQYLQTQSYMEKYQKLGGREVISNISDTYKETIEMYSNYKLNKETKQKVIDKLNMLSRKLQEIDRQINTKEVDHQIDFSFVYHDIKLVNLSLSDATKDDIVPVIVLHAMEGIGDLKKEITYIEYR